jgi:O-antigen ligase
VAPEASSAAAGVLPDGGGEPPAGGGPARGGKEPARRIGHFLYASHLLTLWSLGVSNVLLGLGLLAAPWTARRPAALPRAARWLLAGLAAYVVLLAAAILASYEPRTSARATSEAFNLASLLLALALVRGEEEARRLVDGAVGVASVVAGAGLFQLLLGMGDLQHRIRGPLSHYMTFSGVLLVADLLLAARLATRGGWRSPWRWLALGLLNVALLASLTRSAWLALAVALLVLLLVRAPRLLLAVPAAALLFVVVAPVPLLARLGSIADLSDESNYDRLCMAQAGLKMIAERPLFGIGPDLVKERYPIYRHPSAPRYTIPHLHNSLLQLAAERGLPALAAYGLMMGAAAAAALSRLRAEGGLAGPRADLYLGALLALLAFNVAGLFENNWGDTEVQRLALFVLALPFVAAPAAAGDRHPPAILPSG